jgi:uncharacterized RDD family membrane protein YckC
MNWYYVEAGQQVGPVTEAEFLNLVNTGRIQPSTLVWREGLANWQPYATTQETAAATSAAGMTSGTPMQTGAATVSTADAQPAAAAGEVVCAECGKIFPMGNAIQYGGRWVCANCKPLFVQKLKEGAALPSAAGAMAYAGFWIRFCAVFIDGIILWVVNVAVGMAAGLSLLAAAGINPKASFSVLQLVLLGFQIAIGMAYEVFFLGKFGATLGKMACGLRVVTAEGAPISYLHALGRYLSKILSYVTCTIGFIIAAFDSEKRALHDHICNTRVIQR